MSTPAIALKVGIAALAIAVTSSARADYYTEISPVQAYVKYEWNGPDWILVYRMPPRAIFVGVRPQTWRAGRLWNFAASMGGLTVQPPEVRLSAGLRARLLSAGVAGDLGTWRNEMKIRIYVPNPIS